MDASDWDLVAKDYYAEVISPLKDCVKNPLLKELEEKDFSNSVVLDAGCGVGRLLPLLSKKFREVHAKDFSSEMIKQATKKSEKLTNVNCFVKDLKECDGEEEKYDVLISVNSLLDPSILNITKGIEAFFSSIKKGGVFYGILPSMESYLYQGILMFDKKATTIEEEEKVIEEVNKKLKVDSFDYNLGLIDFDGDKQKAFYRFELWYRFKKAGFSNIQIGKVLYDWKEWREAGQTYFPKEHPPWDWYLKCEKKN